MEGNRDPLRLPNQAAVAGERIGMFATRSDTIFALGMCVLLLAGCNAGSDADGANSSPDSNATPTGVWSGTDSVSGLAVTAIINSTGQAAFLRADGVQFDGTVQMSGNGLAVAVDGYSNFGATFSDGATTGVGTLTGTVITGTSLTATLSFTTSDGTSIGGSWSLSFDTLSSSGSSLTAVSANYTDPSSGATVSIDGLGDINSQDPTTDCVLNGTVSTTDKSVDVYQIAWVYQSCTGSAASLNGIHLSGMAVLDSTNSPAQLVIAVTGAGASSDLGIVTYLNAA
jgi:hypothetical protein